MELPLPLTHNPGNCPAGPSGAGADVPGRRAVPVSGGLRPSAPATVRSGSPANCEREGRQADDPRTDQWREQRKEGGAMTRFGTKRIGVLALAVASVTAL